MDLVHKDMFGVRLELYVLHDMKRTRTAQGCGLQLFGHYSLVFAAQNDPHQGVLYCSMCSVVKEKSILLSIFFVFTESLNQKMRVRR